MKMTKAQKDKRAVEFPAGWDEQRVQQLLAHYETQGEDEAVAEDEAAFEHEGTSMVEVPTRLLPAIRDLLAKSE